MGVENKWIKSVECTRKFLQLESSLSKLVNSLVEAEQLKTGMENG